MAPAAAIGGLDAQAVLLFGAAAGFVCGSVPFGLLIARRHGIDIRAHGSGNIGATNVWRVLGPRAGALCFALDVLKGLIPTLSAGWAAGLLGDWRPDQALLWLWQLAMIAPVLGHMFSPFVGFKGGKGVATGLGALLGVYPAMTAAGLGALAVWIVSVKLTRYVGVSSVLAAASLPVWTLLAGRVLAEGGARVAPCVCVGVLLAALVVYKHRGNLRRTLAGTEPRVGRGR